MGCFFSQAAKKDMSNKDQDIAMRALQRAKVSHGYIEKSRGLLAPAIEAARTCGHTLNRHEHNVSCNYAAGLIASNDPAKIKEAENILKSGIEFADMQQANGRGHLNFSYWRNNYAKLLRATGRPNEAAIQIKKVIHECQANPSVLKPLFDAVIAEPQNAEIIQAMLAKP